jgi:hypothetical protein
MYVNIPMLGCLIGERNKENKNRERVSIRLLFGSNLDMTFVITARRDQLFSEA